MCYHLQVFADGRRIARISTCCEYKLRPGCFISGKKTGLKLLSISNGSPCMRCQVDAFLQDQEHEKMQSTFREPKEQPEQPHAESTIVVEDEEQAAPIETTVKNVAKPSSEHADGAASLSELSASPTDAPVTAQQHSAHEDNPAINSSTDADVTAYGDDFEPDDPPATTNLEVDTPTADAAGADVTAYGDDFEPDEDETPAPVTSESHAAKSVLSHDDHDDKILAADVTPHSNSEYAAPEQARPQSSTSSSSSGSHTPESARSMSSSSSNQTDVQLNETVVSSAAGQPLLTVVEKHITKTSYYFGDSRLDFQAQKQLLEAVASSRHRNGAQSETGRSLVLASNNTQALPPALEAADSKLDENGTRVTDADAGSTIPTTPTSESKVCPAQAIQNETCC